MKQVLAGLTALFAALAAPAVAQTPLFSDNSDVAFVIEGPLSTLVRAAPRSTDPYPAAVIFMNGAEPQRFDIELSARGLSRRTRGYCSMPPLRLDFQSPQVRDTPLRGQNKLKLVTRCRAGVNYEQVNVLEYLSYRLYNEITPLSFRVRPAQVTYRDTNGRRDEETHFNFLIEDISDVARRNDRTEVDVPPDTVRSAQLDPQMATQYALFQYMIGNLDWDMVSGRPDDDCCHNSKLVGATAESREAVIPVPYDFDSSGFVDAPYANPPEGLPVRNVRQRYYRGLCRFNDQTAAAVAVFQSRRQAINALIAGESRLTGARRSTAQRYIDEFYEIISDPERLQSQIIERCRR